MLLFVTTSIHRTTYPNRTSNRFCATAAAAIGVCVSFALPVPEHCLVACMVVVGLNVCLVRYIQCNTIGVVRCDTASTLRRHGTVRFVTVAVLCCFATMRCDAMACSMNITQTRRAWPPAIHRRAPGTSPVPTCV